MDASLGLVSVPAKYLPSVYRLLASLTAEDESAATIDVVPPPDVSVRTDGGKDRVSELHQNVTEDGRTLLESVAQTPDPDTLRTFNDLQTVSGLVNPAAALQSLSIQSKRLG